MMMINSPSELLLLLLIIIINILLSNSQTLPINVWPKPTKTIWPTPRFSPLSPHLQIHSPPHPHLQSAVSRYSLLLRSESFHPILPPSPIQFTLFQPITSLTLLISNLSSPLRHAVDESYTLSISTSSGSANLTAPTVWGAMRGLETMSQLTWGDPPVIASDIYLEDRPLFPHRGLLLDTSRNYYPKRDLLRTIDAMSANKLNVFHWHITDSHSFPILLPSQPALAEKGSYGPKMRYTADDVKEIVEYGLTRGVRVMPEIDAPGHTGSWAEAYPEIVTCANKFWLPNGQGDGASRLAAEPGTGQLNPLNPQTYKVVHSVIRDVANLFPEQFYHAGADEIAPACWMDDPTIRAFVADGGTLSQALEIFVNSTLPLIASLNKTAVYWEDVLLDPVVRVDSSVLPPESTILQTWNNGPANTKRIVQAGYRVIVSSSDFYYLDCGHGGFVGNDSRYDSMSSDSGTNGGSWCAPFKTWQRVYDYDVTYGLSEEEAELVLGGEVALWSEQADGTVLDARLWPRASAMAEALWSGNRDETGRKRYAEATDRLTDWRHRMVGRGVGAEPIQPLWCRRNPGMCNLVQ